ncbi:MAG: hypothetical protein GXY19_17070 [Phycisphaerae bacterium]|nr:hypothetical protein [Phycisphaerae bacterium]
MMRIVSILLILVSFSLALAQEEGTTNPPQRERTIALPLEEYTAVLWAQSDSLEKEWGKSPASLAEAHARLERMLSPKELAKIDAMDSEDGMIRYHFSLGLGIRNAWGLWAGSALARHMQELGFTHPDEMSGTILETFWCKRHARDFRLEERATGYKKRREAEENRIARGQAAMRAGMMGLRFEKQDAPNVSIAVRHSGVRARLACPFRKGVFLTVYRQGRLGTRSVRMQESYVDPNGDGRPASQYDDFVHRGYGFDPTERDIRRMKPGEDSYTQGYYFDPADGKLHRIHVPEVNEVYSAVVTGDRAWFAGLTGGRLVGAGIGNQDRLTVPLPQDDEMPDLGIDGQSLLAVYTKTIYRLVDRTWTVVPSGGILLPRSGLPPRLCGDTIFFREEDDLSSSSRNRLWWLTMSEPLHLSVLDRDVGALAADGPDWHDVVSYCVTSDGDLWGCVGEHYLSNCLFRRSRDGNYSIAILRSSVRFLEEGWPKSQHAYQGAAVSAIAPLSDGAFVLAGRTGLYRLKGDELVQELAFDLDRPLVEVKERDRVLSHVTWRRQGDKMVKEVTEVVQKAPEKRRQVVSSVPWLPNNVLLLDDGSYFITADTWEGAYWLRQGEDGQWSCLPLDEGGPVVW